MRRDTTSSSMHVDEFEEFPGKALFDEYWRTFKPLVVRNVSFLSVADVNDLINSDVDIDVSYTLNNEDTLQGDPQKRLFSVMKASAFARRFVGVEAGQVMWARPGEPHYYVSQVPLFSALEGQTALLSKHFRLPSFPLGLSGRQLESVNAWINIEKSHTSLHYDSFNNILLVTKGSKTVFLTSPENTVRLSPNAAYSGVANHSPYSLMASNLSPHQVARVELAEGDCVFIPEGWWHEVISAPLTVAEVENMLKSDILNLHDYALLFRISGSSVHWETCCSKDTWPHASSELLFMKWFRRILHFLVQGRHSTPCVTNIYSWQRKRSDVAAWLLV